MNPDITNEELMAIIERVTLAGMEDWEMSPAYDEYNRKLRTYSIFAITVTGDDFEPAVANFIVNARQDIYALLSHISTLEERLALTNA